MKAPELFGVVIRTIGFGVMARGVWLLIMTAISASAGAASFWPWPLFLLLLLSSAFGAVCFFAADSIVRLAYERAPLHPLGVEKSAEAKPHVGI